MTGIVVILTVLLFLLFLVLGIVAHYRKLGGKWIYFTLSAISVIAVLVMVVFLNWSMFDLGKNSTNVPPKTETPADPTNETPQPEDPKEEPVNEDPVDEKPVDEDPVDEDPVDEKPVDEDPVDEDPVDEDPVDPEPEEPKEIIVPDNETVNYTVVAGDTLWSISTRANVTVEKIKQWNNLTSDIIYVGQILKLHGKNVEPPPPADPPKDETPSETASSIIISHGSLQVKEIALTFDAGSDAIGIGILEVLKKHNVKATFFLTGSWADKFPNYAKQIVKDGHEIGNHTYSHPDAVKTGGSIFKQDIIKAEDAIERVTGVSPQPIFRFPYGSSNSAALKIVGETGYPYSIHWTIDTIDWQQPSADVIVSRIQNGASNGDIILMHIGGINTPAAVDRVIPILKSMGYKLVTVGELLDI